MSADAKSKKPQLTLKRRVSIKAVVTEKFKDYLRLELNQSVEFSKNRLKELSAGGQVPPQFVQEQQQLQATIDIAPEQEKMINDLEVDSFYSQGNIEGLVNVSVGDNLYEKLSGVEVTVKDSIVQKITPIVIKDSPFNK